MKLLIFLVVLLIFIYYVTKSWLTVVLLIGAYIVLRVVWNILTSEVF